MKKGFIFIYLLIFFCFETVDSPNVEANKINENPNYGTVSIEKISLNRNFYKDGNVDKEIVMLDSEFPNIENSLLVLASHSGTSPFSFFNYLYKLELGDIVNITYNDELYNYKIIDVYQVKKDGSAEIYKIKNKRTLVLITCTNNKKDKQTVYVAVEI